VSRRDHQRLEHGGSRAAGTLEISRGVNSSWQDTPAPAVAIQSGYTAAYEPVHSGLGCAMRFKCRRQAAEDREHGNWTYWDGKVDPTHLAGPSALGQSAWGRSASGGDLGDLGRHRHPDGSRLTTARIFFRASRGEVGLPTSMSTKRQAAVS
jgi:hypothetical protein